MATISASNFIFIPHVSRVQKKNKKCLLTTYTHQFLKVSHHSAILLVLKRPLVWCKNVLKPSIPASLLIDEVSCCETVQEHILDQTSAKSDFHHTFLQKVKKSQAHAHHHVLWVLERLIQFIKNSWLCKQIAKFLSVTAQEVWYN